MLSKMVNILASVHKLSQDVLCDDCFLLLRSSSLKRHSQEAQVRQYACNGR